MIGQLTNVEQLAGRELAGETKVLGQNPPQCHFVHHKFNMISPVIELGVLWRENSV
jgi:hypothetical protein